MSLAYPDPAGDFALAVIFLTILTAAAYPFGRYIAGVARGTNVPGPLLKIESFLYRHLGIVPDQESNWKGYARDMLVFNALGFLILLAILLLQGFLPLNPQQVPGFSLDIALNAAMSFVTNTNWQVYSGEVTASYLAQVAGFAVQNFLSAATGICIALAVMRGLTRKETGTIGNFWVDMIRIVLYILLPIAFVGAVVLLSQGVIQNFDPYVTVTGVGSTGSQTIPMGPVASQEAIKELGTNGGGFFNANSAHPYENPTPFTNLAEVFLILIIPAALPFAFGKFAGNMRQGWAIYAVMILLFVASFAGAYFVEGAQNPRITALGVDGIPMEGKEVRFGLFGTTLFTVTTTATSCGAVNSMFDSNTPLGGMVPMFLILLGEVVFGGVGSGLYTMLAYIVVAVFIAGLMIGRTPEYLGKKIEVFEMKMAILTILVPSVLVLIFTGIAVVTPGGLGSILNPGAHGLSEVMYAFASMANNNGSAFAGLNGGVFFYAIGGVAIMAIGRFVPAVAILAFAGSVAGKKIIPPGAGTLPTTTVVFVLWLIGIIIIVGVLTFFPFFALGPLIEHLTLAGGV